MTDSPLTPSSPTGLGWHYFPDELHYRQHDAEQWLPRLQRLGANWLTLRGSLQRAIPEPFIQAVLAAGITPVVHLPIKLGSAPLPELEHLFRAYANWGVRFVVVYDQPNRRTAWPAAEWSRPGLVDRYAQTILPLLKAMHAANLTPVLPPLAQGGDYWDTAFLQATLNALLKHDQHELLLQSVQAVYGYTFGRQVAWGRGGAEAWPNANPYNPETGENSQGFNAFAWYSEIIQDVLGEPRPLLMLAGGARHSDKPTAAADLGWHAAANLEIASQMRTGQLPAELLNVSFWQLAGEPDGWYTEQGEPTLAVKELTRLAARTPAQVATVILPSPPIAVAKSSPATEPTQAPESAPAVLAEPDSTAAAVQPTPPPIADAPLRHYLLLPEFAWGGSQWYWQVIADYVQRFRPTCGFSLDEAALAEAVTIIRAPNTFNDEQVQNLHHACQQVDEIHAEDSNDLQHIFSLLVQQGVRFQHQLITD